MAQFHTAVNKISKKYGKTKCSRRSLIAYWAYFWEKFPPKPRVCFWSYIIRWVDSFILTNFVYTKLLFSPCMSKALYAAVENVVIPCSSYYYHLSCCPVDYFCHWSEWSCHHLAIYENTPTRLLWRVRWEYLVGPRYSLAPPFRYWTPRPLVPSLSNVPIFPP